VPKTDFTEKILPLVTPIRRRNSTITDTRSILIESESDKGRVINSASFRRLQQKAQVFPLEPNAAVRSRLTHSIEVSQVGRHIAQKVIESTLESSNQPYIELAAFVNTIETACLLHDIGNPPFGHLGETAIQCWFTKSKFGDAREFKDLCNFDGNPQGYRIASFLSGKDSFGLNLTCTQLLSMIKYPTDVTGKDAGAPYKKIGIFDADYAGYEDACEKLDWVPRRKFPFVYLMDAADDIAYSMSDLEDGIEKKVVSIEVTCSPRIVRN